MKAKKGMGTGCGRHAFSLVEVMVALAVFAVAVVSLSGLLAASAAASRDARQRTMEMVIVPQVAEALRACRPVENNIDGAPLLLRDHLPLEFPEATAEGPLVLAFDASGGQVAGDFSDDYTEGTRHPLATHFAVVSVRGVEARANMAELEIVIESPAVVAAAERRRSHYFSRLHTGRNGAR